MQLSNDRLANIAHDYYLSDLNISEIATKYDLSRYLVDKALEDARKKGIVQISIKESTKRNNKLEQIFKTKFGLKEAYILKKTDTKNQDNEKLVGFAAEQIERNLQSAHNVGLSWGTTMIDIIHSFSGEKNENLNFVQLVGNAFHGSVRKNPLEQIAAQKFNASFQELPAPLYVTNPEITKLIKNEPFYQELNESYNHMDLIITCLGTVQALEENSFLGEKYEDILFKDVKRKSVAGMVLGRPYNYDGYFFSPVTNKIIGISDEQIMKVPRRFTIVTNRFKADALIGALRSGIITHLITNEGIAERALQKLKYSKNK